MSIILKQRLECFARKEKSSTFGLLWKKNRECQNGLHARLLATPTARTHGLHARSPLEYLTTLLARVKSLCGSEKMADSDLVMKSSNSLLWFYFYQNLFFSPTVSSVSQFFTSVAVDSSCSRKGRCLRPLQLLRYHELTNR